MSGDSAERNITLALDCELGGGAIRNKTMDYNFELNELNIKEAVNEIMNEGKLTLSEALEKAHDTLVEEFADNLRRYLTSSDCEKMFEEDEDDLGMDEEARNDLENETYKNIERS
jgi:hypothetical protein